jgi:hypothetical protein
MIMKILVFLPGDTFLITLTRTSRNQKGIYLNVSN